MIVEEQGHYLVIEQSPGHFAFPGGFMRWREHPVQAARREGKEETGLDMHIGDIIGYYHSSSSRFAGISSLVIIYAAQVAGGKLRSSVEGEPRWLSELELRSKMSIPSQRILEDYLRFCSGHAKSGVPENRKEVLL